MRPGQHLDKYWNSKTLCRWYLDWVLTRNIKYLEGVQTLLHYSDGWSQPLYASIWQSVVTNGELSQAAGLVKSWLFIGFSAELSPYHQNWLPWQRARREVRENVIVITKPAAKKVQTLQAVECFDCFQLLVQKWTSTHAQGGTCQHVGSNLHTNRMSTDPLPVAQTEWPEHHGTICIPEQLQGFQTQVPAVKHTTLLSRTEKSVPYLLGEAHQRVHVLDVFHNEQQRDVKEGFRAVSQTPLRIVGEDEVFLPQRQRVGSPAWRHWLRLCEDNVADTTKAALFSDVNGAAVHPLDALN